MSFGIRKRSTTKPRQHKISTIDRNTNVRRVISPKQNASAVLFLTDKIESAQRSFTHRIPGFASLNYIERTVAFDLERIKMNFLRFVNCYMVRNINLLI